MIELPARTWTIVKLRPDGSEAARYPGTPLASPPGWVAARAIWRYQRLDAGYLVFEPGDELDEFFSLESPCNAFALYRDGVDFVGWYCNVTYPTTVSGNTIYWHDLYVDVIVYPDGGVLILDEDELLESGLAQSDPALHARILVARDELIDMAAVGAYPFSEARPNHDRPIAIERDPRA